MDAVRKEIIRRLRVGDVGKLLTARCGPVLPDDDAGREYLLELLKPISLGPKASERMPHAVELRAPWMSPDEADDLMARVAKVDRWPTSKALGKALRLTNAEREHYRLWMIAPCDVTTEELAEQKKAKERARKARCRRQKGARSRKEYLDNAVNRNEPWLPEGISRRTWYRRQKGRKRKNPTLTQVRPHSSI